MIEIQGIFEDLKSSDWWDRKNAIEKLLAHPEDSYLPVLAEWLRNHDDALLRNASMETYRALGIRAVDSLSSLLRDDDAEVRLFAANVLGDIGHAAAVSSLVKAVNDPDANVRIASAEALGKIRDENALDALGRTLDDEPWVAMAGIQAIGDIGGEKALVLLYACLDLEEYRGFVISAIAAAGNRGSIKYLTPFIENPAHVFHSELALEAIIRIAERESIRLKSENFKELVPMLLAAVSSPDADTRKPAFIALCWSGDARGIPYFIKAIRDEEFAEYAIDGLLSTGIKAAPALVEALRDSEGDHRVLLAKVLSMLGENRALIEFTKDENPGVRTEVAQALGSVNSSDSVRALLKMLSDPFEEVRLAARKSLSALKKGKVIK
ncbi:MAG: HEAT repeat domain-containing protein [Nitrospirota bacterium]|nr:HEAT repeat domain-containing protein [Nitrospirota bacterium]